MDWYKKKPAELAEELGTDLKNGLSTSKAEQILKEHGHNKLEAEKKASLFSKFVDQFKDPLTIILIIAAILSAFLGDLIETAIILAIVVINAGLSIYQEGKAEEAVEALQEMSSPSAKVIRDGKELEILSKNIVPGDIVLLETGDIVPADIRLIESSNLQIDESSLTGESVPVEKDAKVNFEEVTEIGDRTNYAHSSTIVSYGRGKGLVTDTGHDTEIGKIATSLQTVDDEFTPLQKRLNDLSKLLGILVLAVCGIVLVVGVLRDYELLDMIMMSISLAVAAIPEGLAAIVTIVLSLGMGRMAERNAIVKKLLAVESLGTITTICSDKTGTLTQNEMTVQRAFVDNKVIDVAGTGYEPVGELSIEGKTLDDSDAPSLYTLMSIGALSNDSLLRQEDGLYKIMGDPTEAALLTLAGKKGLKKNELEEKYPRIEEIPFDSDRKMMSTFHENFIENKIVSFTKGAPDLIIDRCDKKLVDGKVSEFTEEEKKLVLDKNIDFAKSALRTLAYAFKQYDELPSEIESENIENNMIFVGITGTIDPARPEAKAAIKECKTAGITPIMITGDHLETAYAIAEDLGIANDHNQAMLGKELNTLNPEEIREVVKTKRVFARVSPENKVQIVEALKANGHIVSMTGDGVNDAPALKKADIGVAMGITGTGVAKNTAEVILMDDNFATIVHAVEEGRIIYNNIKNFVSFLLSCNIGEVLIVFLAILFGLPVPLTPIQLLWLNLVTDSFPALALGVEKGADDIMEEKPREPNEAIIDKKSGLVIGVQAVAITLATLGAYLFGIKVYGLDSEGSRTLAFATLITAELLRAFSARSSDHTLREIGLFSNKYMVYATGLSFGLLLMVLYIPALANLFEVIPPTVKDWAVIIVLSLIPVIAGEFRKALTRKRKAQ